MILKSSSSAPLLAKLGDADFSLPVNRRSSSKARLLHLRCNSSAFAEVRSESDLQKFDREKRESFHGYAADEKPTSYMPRTKNDHGDNATEKYSRVRSVGYDAETNLVGVGGGFGIGDGEDFSVGQGGGDSNNNVDAYYRKQLEANPGNSLLLRNYARFLCEVRNDVKKAEEYYERAILASPGEADVLCLYANLIWQVYNDKPRAESYFHRAMEAAPDDSYVVGAYANFLWNTEEDEDETAPLKEPQVFYNDSTGAATASACG